jgi:anti-sigma B factor antagonist
LADGIGNREVSFMSVKLSTRQIDGVSLVDVSGRLTLGEGASALRNTLSTMAAEGQDKILLNLEGLSYLDSSGIGTLVSSFDTISNRGGQLKLLHLTKRVRDLLVITKLYTVFEVYDDQATAFRGFARPLEAEATYT